MKHVPLLATISIGDDKFEDGTSELQVFLPPADKTQQLLAAGKEPVRIVCIGDSITAHSHTP